MKLYARRGGWHFHTDSTPPCPLLANGDFERLKYRRIYWAEIVRRNLRPCMCVGRTRHHRAIVAVELEKRKWMKNRVVKR